MLLRCSRLPAGAAHVKVRGLVALEPDACDRALLAHVACEASVDGGAAGIFRCCWRFACRQVRSRFAGSAGLNIR
jgi:hypothetical protein